MNKKRVSIIVLAAALLILNVGQRANAQNIQDSCTSCNTPEILVLQSPNNLRCNDTVRVYSPKNEEPMGTLLLLHGWSGNYRDWGDKVNIQHLADKYGFRIITPDGFYNSWYLNNSNPAKMQAREFYNNELLPYLIERYALTSDNTFIDGLSMGGHGAINIFIDNHSLFRAAASMSGVLNLAYMPASIKKELNKVIGNKVNRVAQESAIKRVEKIAGSKKTIILSCGYSDYFYPSTKEFAALCREYKIPCIELYGPGSHSWIFWEYALNQHLWYFRRIIEGESLGE